MVATIFTKAGSVLLFSISATLVLNGDTTIALADPDLFKTEAGIQLPTFLSIIEVEMVDVLIFGMYNGLLGPQHDTTCLWGCQQNEIQTGLLDYRD